MVGINILILHVLRLAKIAENCQVSKKFNHEVYKSVTLHRKQISQLFLTLFIRAS